MEYTISTVVACLLGGILGMFAHIIKKKIRKQTTTAIIRYFKKNVGHTFMAFIGMLGLIATVYTPEFELFKAFAVGMTSGFSCDSMFNK